jgi:putative addiction module component (TIGR02574 family)
MPKYAAHILAEALELPPVERAELVENILSSFEFQARNTINALWAQEAEDRIDAFQRGEMSASPQHRSSGSCRSPGYY